MGAGYAAGNRTGPGLVATAMARPRTLRLLLAAPVAALVLASCGASSGEVRAAGTDAAGTSVPGDGATTTTTNSGGLDLPADQVVWRESTGGGFVDQQVDAGNVADVTVLGDGTIYVSDPEARTRYDEPIPVRTGHVEPAALAAFLAEARASGLFDGEVDLGSPGVTDWPTTVVELHDADGQANLSAYALRFEDEAGGGVYGLSKEQAAARAALRDLLAAGRALAADTEPWTPDRVRATDFGGGEGLVPEGAESKPWPGPAFDTIPAGPEGGESCFVLTGDDATAVWQAGLGHAGSLWSQGGENRQIFLAPLLPGDDGCPS